MTKKAKNLLLAYALVFPAFAVVMLIVAYPIVSAVMRSFTASGQEGFTLENYLHFFTSPNEIRNILYTLMVVIITVLLAMAFSYSLALYLRFSKSKISKFIGGMYLLPRFVPGVVAVCAMITILRDSGVINRVSQLFGENIKPGFVYDAKGLITMNLWFNIPFATLIITSALSSIPDSIIESARDVGATRLRVFTKMILPLSVKDVMIAGTFVFMGNVGSFTTPYLMGPNAPKMLGIALFDQFNAYMDYERAAALSVIMFLICSVSAGVYIHVNLKEKDWEK